MIAKMSGIQEQINKVQQLYTNNIRELGISSLAVGWKTEHCQRLRFAKLASLIEDPSKGCTLNDYGCGYGAMLSFMMEDQRYYIEIYNGYDISPDMLAAAKHELGALPVTLNLIESDQIQTEADYSFVSGTFNVSFDAEKEAWEDLIRAKLQEMFKYSRIGFGFNLLTSYVDYEEANLYYGDPCYWFDYCKRNFSKQAALLHDYPLWEWTMLVRKE